MKSLIRNDLVWIDALAWQQIEARDWDVQAREILAHWRSCSLPFVVCRQRVDVSDHEICLGLPAPSLWGRRRLALQVLPDDVKELGSFPTLMQVAQANHWGPAADTLKSALLHCGTDTRVYGSHGWQFLTGLNYLHDESDIDLTIQVRDFETACKVVQQLAATQLPRRLDGEIVFVGGQAVAWRELNQLLEGQVAQVMVKERGCIRLAAMSTVCQYGDSRPDCRSET